MDTSGLVDTSKISRNDGSEALELFMFLAEKRGSRIKVWICTNERKKKEYTKK